MAHLVQLPKVEKMSLDELFLESLVGFYFQVEKVSFLTATAATQPFLYLVEKEKQDSCRKDGINVLSFGILNLGARLSDYFTAF